MKLAWTDADFEDVYENALAGGAAKERAAILAELDTLEKAIKNPFQHPEWPGLVRAISIVKTRTPATKREEQ